MDNKQPTKALIKRILGGLKRSKIKFINLERLSRIVGLYPEVLGEALALFHPLILMDPEINIRDLEPQMKAYLEEPIPETKAKKKAARELPVSKKELNSYSSIADFALKKLTNVGGLVDPTITLSDHDLRVLDKLVEAEQQRRKKANTKNKAGR